MRRALPLLGALLLAGACASPRARVAVAAPKASAAVEAGASGSHIPKSVLPNRGKTSARAHGLGAFSDFAP